MTETLRNRLIRYFKNNPTSIVASGDIQRMVANKTTYTPRTAVRRLEELANEGILNIKMVKGHAWYHLASKTSQNAELSVPEALKKGGDWFKDLPVK